MGESGYSISSQSGSSGYSTLMLTDGAQVEYPELLDHDLMNNPSEQV